MIVDFGWCQINHLIIAIDFTAIGQLLIKLECFLILVRFTAILGDFSELIEELNKLWDECKE